MTLNNIALIVLILLITASLHGQTPRMKWPEGKKVAVSLSFDDARFSQVDKGTAVLDKYNVKATFYVMPGPVKERLEGWKKSRSKWT